MAVLKRIVPTILLAMLAGCVAPQAGRLPADPDPFGPLGWLLSPSQGRPALVRGGEPLRVEFRVPVGFAGRVEYQIVDSQSGAAVLLKAMGDLRFVPPPPAVPGMPALAEQRDAESLAAAVLEVPPAAGAGLYDLTIAVFEKNAAAPLRVKSAPRAVAVLAEFPDSFRFVQLSNMNVGTATAPTFSRELVEEVNRVAPAFIVTTGDYTESAAPAGRPDDFKRIKEYFAQFDAPVFLVAGEHEDEAAFAKYVSPSKCGRFTFGRCQGVLLHDTYRHPIDSDRAQYQWLDSVLNEANDVQFSFLVTPNDSLRVFDAWKKMGYQPRDYALRNRIGMIFVGGYSDWDFQEYAAKLADAPLHYIRTHASSTVIRGKASGVPHYRIVQIDRGGPGGASSPADNPVTRTRVSLAAPENGPVQRALHSVPVGRVQVDFDQPNDGSADRVKVSVLNRLTVPLPGMRVKVRLKPGKTAVAAAGGVIERVIDRDNAREAWLRLDVPDLGTASAVVGPADSLPRPRSGVALDLLGDEMLHYHAARSADGFGYFITDGQLQLDMHNANREPAAVWPVVRLNGNVLTLRGVPAGGPIRLMPGERRTLPINTPLALAAPGEHWLTVHSSDDPLPFAAHRSIYLLVTEPPRATTQPGG